MVPKIVARVMYSYCAHFASCIFDKHLLIYTFINMIRLISLLIGSISTLDFSFVEDGYRVNTTRSRSSRMWPNQQRLACFRAIRPAGSWDHACSNAWLAATGLHRRRPLASAEVAGNELWLNRLSDRPLSSEVLLKTTCARKRNNTIL